MYIDVEIKIRGQRNRIQIGTIERDPENVDKHRVGLQLAEVKSLIAVSVAVIPGGESAEMLVRSVSNAGHYSYYSTI